MTAYAYEARNRKGELFTGRVSAESRRGAARQIRAKGLWVASLEELGHGRHFPALARIKAMAAPQPSRLLVVLFCRQLAVMLSAGMPVHEALKALRTGKDSSYQQLLDKLLAAVMQGKSLHEAMQGFPKVFSARIVSLVKAGEVAGTLDVMFLRLADFLEKSYAAQAKLKSVLLYPLILGVTTLVAFAFMTVFVLPTFSAMLTSLHTELPLPTRLLLAVSALVLAHGPELFLVSVAVLVLAAYAWQQEGVRRRLDRWCLRLPLYGRLVCFAEWLMLLGTLAVLLENGIRLPAALALLPEVTANCYLRLVLQEARQAVERGLPLHASLCACPGFPAVLGEMVLAGEKSGELELMLAKAAEFCRVVVQNESRRLQALAEPAAIFLVGGLVFFFFLSSILPLLGMMDALT